MNKINFNPFNLNTKLPIILQNENSECGLACLAMLSSYHGRYESLASLKNNLEIDSSTGLNLKQLLMVGNKLGMSNRVLSIDLMSLKEISKPAILHWDMNHFVVLKKTKSKKVIIHDPAVGMLELTYEEVSKHFTGIVIEFEPNKNFELSNQIEIPTLKSIMGNTAGLVKSLSHILLASFLLQIVGLISPALMQWMIDHSLSSGNQDLIFTLILGMAFLMLFNLSLSIIRSWMVMFLSITLGFKWSSRILTHLLHLPVNYFEKRHLGDVLSRFGSVSSIQQTITSGVISAILDGLFGIMTFVMIWLYSPTLALTAIVSIILLIIIQFLTFEKQKSLANESLVASAKVSSNLMESIRGIRPIKLAGRENLRKSTWQNLTIESINIGIRGQWLNIAIGTTGTLISRSQRIIAIYIAASMITQGQFSIGMLFAYLAYQDQFLGRMSGLVNIFFQFKMLRLHFERLSDIVLTEPENMYHLSSNNLDSKDYQDGKKSLTSFNNKKLCLKNNSIEFKNISFQYSKFTPNILNDLSFSTKGSACTVIKGKSGIGKTTIFKLIMGIYKPISGEIYVNGLSMNNISVEELRNHIACVLQDDVLFAGSILENIAFFDPELNRERVIECAKIACIHEDIDKKIMKYQTPVGDMGSTLSAGQKQRILIARALYSQPKILLLDEATSALDLNTEEKINKNLAKLDLHRIYIAHRPQTIRFGDQIIDINVPDY